MSEPDMTIGTGVITVIGRVGRLVATGWIAVLLPASVDGQTATLPLPHGDSSIRITVEDQTGAVIPLARVIVTAPSGASVERLTDDRGRAIIDNVAPGLYRVRAEFEGFEPVVLDDVRVRGRETRREIRLPIARIADQVTVGRDPREARTDPRGDAFATVLTRDQIDQLPDDPEELENALGQMAGPGAVMRVNGFRGGRLPPKSQIQEIRFRRNVFAADSHEPGFIAVDIRTRPGSDAFRASVDIAFRDETLNSRNAFAPRKGEEQQRRFGVSLEGPLWKDRTSFALNTDGFDAFDSKTIVAALTDGPFNDVVRRPSDRIYFNARVEHALTKNHALRAELQHGSTMNRNLGVGDFDLPERAFSRDLESRLFRISESGAIGHSLFNELRFQVSWQDTISTPAVNAPAVLVLNAFSSGGAQIRGGRSARTFEIADNLDIARGRQTMRAGVLVEGGSYHSDEASNGNGVFTFASLAAYEAAIPTTFAQRVGEPLVEYSHFELGWYVQDDIRARKDLTLSFGVRHEMQSHLDDWLNLAPRAGFTWSPFRSGKTTLRGGAGIFYDWYETDAYEQTLRVNGIRQQDIVVRYPAYPDPYFGGAVNTLPAGRVQADPGMRMPTLFQTSIGVERQLGPMSRLNLAYFETRGWYQLRGRNINAPIDGVRPDPSLGNVTQIESTAESRSRMLSVNLNVNSPQRRMFTFLNYALGYARNEADGALSLPADNYNLDAEWGPAANDVRHRFMGMITLPVWRRLQFSSQFRASSAPPYTVITGFDDNGDTISNDRPTGVGRNTARAKGQWDVSGRLQYSFGFGARQQPAGPGTPQVRIVRAGDDGGQIGGGGGMMMGGAMDKRVRADVYLGVANIFNHVNHVNFSGVQTSPFFGEPTAAMPGRRMEIGARVSF